MSVNNKEIPILVIYYTKEKIICQKEFGSFSNFGTLLEYFNKNVKADQYQLRKIFNKWYGNKGIRFINKFNTRV